MQAVDSCIFRLLASPWPGFRRIGQGIDHADDGALTQPETFSRLDEIRAALPYGVNVYA